MTSKYREWVFDSAKFASTVLTYWLITLLPWEFGFVGGKLLEAVLEVSIASLIASFFWSFIAGRPTLELQWRLGDNQVEPDSGRPTIVSGQAVNLQVHVSGDSLFCRLIRSYVKHHGLRFEIDLHPVGSHLVTVQRGRNDTLTENQTRTGLVFYGIRPDPGIKAAVAIRVKRDDGITGGYPIDLRIRQSWSPKLALGWPKLLKVQTGIDGFNLQGG
ncbi:hypothetical protein FHR72_003635 [Mycolicibacterium iranicum]|uniref:Uncharacterized protein n=1 Tax=Mycolicibacterium iranicum TaxID=912594 RepID=A0A839Q807_MYCIR|nr:hypothetical protein [Mycolicibacterium iranicum]MBB2992139.1 hypothetical protein [Mycolicibacterium iranicum]